MTLPEPDHPDEPPCERINPDNYHELTEFTDGD